MEKEEKSLWVIDILILLAGLVFSSLFLLESYGEDYSAAALLPNIVAVTCILLGISLFVTKGMLLRKARSPMMRKEEGLATNSPESQTVSLLAWWWSYIAIAVYFLFILLIGFIWATLLYILILPFFMHYKKWKVAFMTSVIVTACMYVAFSVVLKITLPTGILF
jgi:hypothetical protein